jgi:hypothetical protein
MILENARNITLRQPVISVNMFKPIILPGHIYYRDKLNETKHAHELAKYTGATPNVNCANTPVQYDCYFFHLPESDSSEVNQIRKLKLGSID